MGLSRKELTLLRLSDGIATTSDLKRLSREMTQAEIEGWRRLPAMVSAALMVEEVVVDVANSVLHEINAGDSKLSAVICAGLLDPSGPIDVVQDVLRAVGEPSSVDEVITTAIRDPQPPNFQDSLDAIMNRIQHDEESAHVAAELDTVLDELERDNNDVLIAKGREPILHVVTQEPPSTIESQLDVDSHSADFLSVVEFTEDIEIDHMQNEVLDFLEAEEDSDEICFVDELHVDEAMLNEQANQLSRQLSLVTQALLPPNEANIDVWSAVRPRLTKPPLRFVRDEIEVVDKYPEVEAEPESSHVEFLNSKSIDADSTISKVSITVLGSFLAIAALWLVIVLPNFVTRTSGHISTPTKSMVAFEVAEVNELEVENLEVAESVNVQILQGEENAPTIIFIDDAEDI